MSSKRTYTVVPNMELPSGNECTAKPRRCCRKLANPSMVGTKPFWIDGTTMANTASLCQKLGGLKSTNLHWKITLKLQQETTENRNDKNWVLKLNKEGAEGRMNQRSDFVEAKREMNRLHDEHVKRLQKEVHTFIWDNQDSEGTNNSKDLKNKIIKSMPKHDGGPILQQSHMETCHGIQHSRPRQLSESSTTIGSRTKVGILGDHPGLNSSDFLVQRCFFACRKVNSLAIEGSVDRCTPHFHMYRSQSTDDMCALLKGPEGSSLSCVSPKRSFSHASCFTLRLTAR